MEIKIKEYLSVLISFLALTVSCLSFIANRNKARSDLVIEFFLNGNSNDQKSYRKIIYNIEKKCGNNYDALKSALLAKNVEIQICKVISFYDTWGLLFKKHQLPLWTFEGAAGERAKKIYSILTPYIDFCRKEKSDNYYAKHFEYLISHL